MVHKSDQYITTQSASAVSAEVLTAKQRFGIVGNTPALIEAVQRALRVAPIDLSVLVTGESGSGKEFFPQIIHQFSARKHAKYIAVNCGAIPEGTIDSELFGHEKGSFTGAVASRKGYFEEADGGTIFLDEVAELPLTTQARLLRVLETGEFIKVGSSTVQRTNIRIVAATNVDMVRAVAQGRFREDLYYRLSTVQISVPPLRARGSDITLLARKFAADFAERYSMPQIQLADDARRMLLSYPWPGNVRQLKNVVEQMALFEAGNIIDMARLASYLPADTPMPATADCSPVVRGNAYEHEREMLFNLIFRMQREIDELRLKVESRQPAPAEQYATPSALVKAAPVMHQHSLIAKQASETADTHHAASDVMDVDAIDDASPLRHAATLEETERETIRMSLARHDGKRKAVAKELNISERTLYRKLKEYDLD